MTVTELIRALQAFDGDLDVAIEIAETAEVLETLVIHGEFGDEVTIKADV